MARKHRRVKKHYNNISAGPGRPANPDPSNTVLTPPAGTQSKINSTPPDIERVARASGVFNLFKESRNYLAALPRATDDLSRELGLDVIRRMMNDPQISAAIYTYVYQALTNGVRIKPRYTDRNHELYKKGIEMYDFSSRCVEGMAANLEDYDQGIDELFQDVAVNTLVQGNSLTEQTMRLQVGGPLDGKMVPDNLIVKPAEVYAYVVDVHGKLVGVAVYTGKGQKDGAVTPEAAAWVVPSVSATNVFSWEIPVEQLPPGWEVLPVSKFLILTHRPTGSDPRGNSALRPAFNAWYLTMQIWPEYLKYLVQFATPSVKGILPSKCPPYRDPTTGVIQDPLEMLRAELENFQNGGVLAARFETVIELLFSNNDGGSLIAAINLLNHEKVKAILHSILATETAHNQTRAASSTHKDIMDLAPKSLKSNICGAIHRQMFKRWIWMNFGKTAAHLLTPYASLGDIAPEDKAAMLSAYSAAATSGLLHESQLPGVDAELELDVRSEIEFGPAIRMQVEAAKQAQQAAKDQGQGNDSQNNNNQKQKAA